MSKNRDSGYAGERDVVGLVKCPNCSRFLMQLPKGYPLYDVQCTACQFRAQIKTNYSKPRSVVRGAGWDIISKVNKAGYMVPPLIMNFKWRGGSKMGHQEIRFYPFVPKTNLKKYQLSKMARRANYRMFNYRGIDKIPFFTLYKK